MTWGSRKGLLATAAIGAVLIVSVMMARDGSVQPGSPGGAARGRGAAGQTDAPTDLKLELLNQERPELAEPERDPFRFQVRQAPPRPAAPAAPASPVAQAPVAVRPPAPAGPPPPPPIPLKFIGLVEAPTQGGRVAILSDGRGNVVYGKEGDTIEGRYQLLKVGPDAVEMAYVDGKGRQTVRLAGQ